MRDTSRSTDYVQNFSKSSAFLYNGITGPPFLLGAFSVCALLLSQAINHKTTKSPATSAVLRANSRFRYSVPAGSWDLVTLCAITLRAFIRKERHGRFSFTNTLDTKNHARLHLPNMSLFDLIQLDDLLRRMVLITAPGDHDSATLRSLRKLERCRERFSCWQNFQPVPRTIPCPVTSWSFSQQMYELTRRRDGTTPV